MAKLPKKSTVINKNDELFSKITRSKGKCERCGRSNIRLETAHIYSRRYKAVRWDKNNALCLCSGCHFWGHHNPIDFTDFIRDKWPGRDELIKEKMRDPKPLSVEDYVETQEKLKTRLSNVERQ